MKIYFDVNKTILKRKDDNILASYSKNIDKCVFNCDDCWSDIYKYALFTSALNKQYIEDLGFGHKVSCVIPDEVMKGNYFSVSIFGGDRKTTIQEDILIEPSASSGELAEAGLMFPCQLSKGRGHLRCQQ